LDSAGFDIRNNEKERNKPRKTATATITGVKITRARVKR
jgi:hypothetical protein